MKKLFSILLVLAMVLTLAPMAFASEEAGIEEEAIIDEIEEVEEEAAEPIEEPAEEETPVDEPAEVPALDGASGSGQSESDPRKVTTYAEFKAAMEDPGIWYVQIDSLNDTIRKEGSALIAGAQITTTKTLILKGNSVIWAALGSGYSVVDSLLYVMNGGNLTIKGNGSLTFKANGTNAANAVIHMVHDNANVYLYDGITLNGDANGATYGRAIVMMNGNLNIYGGTYTGAAGMKLVGPLCALQIQAGNCRITTGRFTVKELTSNTNTHKPIDVPSGKSIRDYLQVASAYSESDTGVSVFELFSEGPTFISYGDYGILSFKVPFSPSDSPFLVASGQKAENGEYTAILTGIKYEYDEYIFQEGYYSTPAGKYRVALKIQGRWYYSPEFDVTWADSVENDPEYYTVTFSTDYGTAPAAQTVKSGSTVTKPADPVDPSGEKVFQSWATRSIRYFSGQWTFTYRKYDFDQAVTSDRTLYARWEDVPDFAFTKQPVSGTAKKTEGYTYSWALSDTPDSLLIQAWFGDDWHDGSSLMGKTSDTIYSTTISKYRIKATKGSGTVYSDEFTVTWTDSDSAKPAVTIASDGKSAKVTGDWSGLYARVALVLDNGGVSGLYITQATINPDGTILIPEFIVPGLKVKGVNVALVPTLADIQSTTPNAKAMATKMLST